MEGMYSVGIDLVIVVVIWIVAVMVYRSLKDTK